MERQVETETVDYAPDYNVWTCSDKESIVEIFRENVARYRKGDTYYEEHSYKLVKSDEK